jgi:hypothetical protein
MRCQEREEELSRRWTRISADKYHKRISHKRARSTKTIADASFLRYLSLFGAAISSDPRVSAFIRG